MIYPQITINVPVQNYIDNKDIYNRCESTTDNSIPDMYITYSIDDFVKIIDDLDLNKINCVSSVFLFGKDRRFCNVSRIEFDPDIEHILKYNSIQLVNFLMKYHYDAEKFRWLNIALSSQPNFWYTMVQEFLNPNNYLLYFPHLSHNSDDLNLDQYIRFMTMIKLDINELQQRLMTSVQLLSFMYKSASKNNYKMLKHFTGEFVNQCTSTAICLDFQPLIINEIFDERFEFADLFISTYRTLKRSNNLFINNPVNNPFSIISDIQNGRPVSIKSFQYFHSVLITDDISWHSDLEMFIVKLIICMSEKDRLKPEFAYLVTAFPYEATLAQPTIKSPFHLDLINEAMYLE